MRTGRAPIATAPAVACSFGSPKSGGPGRVRRDDLAQSLELSLPDLGEVRALRPLRGGSVKVDRDPELLRDPRSQFLGETDGLGHGRRTDRHERNDVRRPHTRMLAALNVEVDQFGGDLHHPEHGVEKSLPLADQADHAPIVVGIALDVENGHSRCLPRRSYDAFDPLGLASL